MTDREPLANKYGPTRRQEQDRATHPAQDAITARIESGSSSASMMPAKTHEESVRSRLGWIVAGVWIVAGAVIANFIASVAMGAAAASGSLGY